MKRRGRSAPRARQAASKRRTRNDYDFDYGGTTGEIDQNEYGGDLYGGGRYGRGPFEQSQRYGGGGFESGTGAYGNLQRQFENRYTSGGYSGLKTSGRALGGAPGVGSAPSRRGRLPRTATDGGGSASTRRSTSARSTSGRSASRARPGAARANGTSGSERKPRVRSAPRAAGGTARSRARGPAVRGSSARARATRRSPSSAELRSDERIRQKICERLARPFERFDASDLVNEHLDVTDVRVSVAGGMVTLEGTVPERRMKHYIEELVDACPGVQDIDNRIRVRR